MKGRVDVRVRVRRSVEEAFAAFTGEIDTWWKRGPRYRFGEVDGTLVLEPQVGGRFFERFPDGREQLVGLVRAWDPPSGFVLAWFPSHRGGGDASEVEVRFGVVDGGTEVHLQHRGLDQVPGDPRTGLRGTALRNVVAVWWGDVVAGLRR